MSLVSLTGKYPSLTAPWRSARKAHLVFERHRREDLFDRVFRIFYQRWIYTVTFENDEPDVPHC